LPLFTQACTLLPSESLAIGRRKIDASVDNNHQHVFISVTREAADALQKESITRDKAGIRKKRLQQ